MRASFVVCSGEQNFQPFRNQPLGSLYLLSVLEEAFGKNLDLSLIDLRSIKKESAIYHIPERDIYFYSLASIEAPEAEGLVKKIREIYPSAKHIAGGPHINAFPVECSALFDSIALGEGEESIKRMVKDVESRKLKKVYKQEESININNYPIPSRKYLPKSAVVDKGLIGGEFSELPGTAVLFSRGCPYNCYFCTNGIMRGPLRFRSSELIKEEITYLKREYGVKSLAIKDDQSIPGNVKIAKPVLEAIAAMDVKWKGQSRANGIHPDMAKLAKESGCHELGIGIESASQEVLNIINKKIDLFKAQEYLSVLKSVGIGRRLHFILGLPGEPKDIAQKTIDFIKESEPSSVLLSLLCPSPGSELYNHPEKFGIKFYPGITFDKFFTVFGRFDGNEKPQSVFEYEKQTPFGESRSMDQIIDDYQKIQTFLREHNLNT